MKFLIFCMMIEANTVQHLDQVLGFKKENQGISRGLYIQFEGLFIYSRNATMSFFQILHGNRGQHCATSGRCITEGVHY